MCLRNTKKVKKEIITFGIWMCLCCGGFEVFI
jgi:hypothetical protein